MIVCIPHATSIITTHNCYHSPYFQIYPLFATPLKISRNNIQNITIHFNNMLVTTTPTIEGQPIKEYKGLVTGETIIGANFVKDIFASIRDVVGGRSSSYESVLREAKETAIQEMQERAQKMGANAVVAVDLDYETIGSKGSMLMVTASGTAVVI